MVQRKGATDESDSDKSVTINTDSGEWHVLGLIDYTQN